MGEVIKVEKRELDEILEEIGRLRREVDEGRGHRSLIDRLKAEVEEAWEHNRILHEIIDEIRGTRHHDPEYC